MRVPGLFRTSSLLFSFLLIITTATWAQDAEQQASAPGTVHQQQANAVDLGERQGTEIKIDGEEFIIMREEEVLGILTGAKKSEKAGAHK